LKLGHIPTAANISQHGKTLPAIEERPPAGRHARFGYCGSRPFGQYPGSC
jgi:hypothetical protein